MRQLAILLISSASTSNQPFAEWDQIFPDRMVTVTAVDRLVRYATIIEVISNRVTDQALNRVAAETLTMTAPAPPRNTPVVGRPKGQGPPRSILRVTQGTGKFDSPGCLAMLEVKQALCGATMRALTPIPH
jgi:hypothetical protein